jgi:hypothetical protein
MIGRQLSGHGALQGSLHGRYTARALGTTRRILPPVWEPGTLTCRDRRITVHPTQRGELGYESARDVIQPTLVPSSLC